MGCTWSKNEDVEVEKIHYHEENHERETDLTQATRNLEIDSTKQVPSNSESSSAKRPRSESPSRKPKELAKTSRANKSSTPHNRSEKTGHSKSEPTKTAINGTQVDSKGHENILSANMNSKSPDISNMSAPSKIIDIEKDQQQHCTNQKENRSVKHENHVITKQDTRSVVIEKPPENIVTERKTRDISREIDSPHLSAIISNVIGISNKSLLDPMAQVPIINQGKTSTKSPNEFPDYGTENGPKLLNNPYVVINVDHLPTTNDQDNSKNKKEEIKTQRHEIRETGSTFPVTDTDKIVSFATDKMPGSEIAGIKNNPNHVGLQGSHVEQSQKFLETHLNAQQNISIHRSQDKPVSHLNYNADKTGILKTQPISLTTTTLIDKSYTETHAKSSGLPCRDTGFNTPTEIEVAERSKENNSASLAIKSQKDRDVHKSDMLEPNFDLPQDTLKINSGPALPLKYHNLTNETNASLEYISPSQIHDSRVNFPKLDESEEEINSSDHNSTSTERFSENLNDTLALAEKNGPNMHTVQMTSPYVESPPSENTTESKEKSGASIDIIEDTENLHAEKEDSTSKSTSPTLHDGTLHKQDQNESIGMDQIFFSDSDSESNDADIPVNKCQKKQSYKNNTSGLPMPHRRDENTNNMSSSTPASSHHQRPKIPLELPVEYFYGEPVIRDSHFKSSNYAENLASQEIVKTKSALNATSNEIEELEANRSKYSGTVKQLDTFERIVTKAMLKLDKIESHGKPELRAIRKNLVIRMKALLKWIDEERNILQSKL